MAWHPLTATTSVVTVPATGTPVSLAAILGKHEGCQSVLFQALPQNQGRVVIGSDNTVRAGSNIQNPSGTVLAIIGAPTSNTATPPSANGGVPSAPSALALEQFWIDVSNSGDGVVVSFLR